MHDLQRMQFNPEKIVLKWIEFRFMSVDILIFFLTKSKTINLFFYNQSQTWILIVECNSHLHNSSWLLMAGRTRRRRFFKSWRSSSWMYASVISFSSSTVVIIIVSSSHENLARSSTWRKMLFFCWLLPQQCACQHVLLPQKARHIIWLW